MGDGDKVRIIESSPGAPAILVEQARLALAVLKAGDDRFDQCRVGDFDREPVRRGPLQRRTEVSQAPGHFLTRLERLTEPDPIRPAAQRPE